MSEWSFKKAAKPNSLLITPCATDLRDEDSFCLFQWDQPSRDFLGCCLKEGIMVVGNSIQDF